MTQTRSYFPHLLGSIFALFIGIMAYVWIESAKADPVILDEYGKPRYARHAGAR